MNDGKFGHSGSKRLVLAHPLVAENGRFWEGLWECQIVPSLRLAGSLALAGLTGLVDVNEAGQLLARRGVGKS
jgi:hypothetical protein